MLSIVSFGVAGVHRFGKSDQVVRDHSNHYYWYGYCYFSNKRGRLKSFLQSEMNSSCILAKVTRLFVTIITINIGMVIVISLINVAD